MYTRTINGGDLSAVTLDIVYGWKVKWETIHLHLIINPKKYMFLLGDQLFSKSRRCSLVLFLNKYSFILEKNECREIS